MRKTELHTVCQSAKCPNLHECWHKRKATFMILGDSCTRNCRFCAVPHSEKLPPPSPDEAVKLASAVAEIGLDYVVITSVTRDDLSDGGASHFADCIREIRKVRPDLKVEVLVPDFGGLESSILKVIEAAPTVFNHNIETVRRLTPMIRSGADFERSLSVLSIAHALSRGGIFVKSGIMLGLGEKDDEVLETICEIRRTGADIITIGQYLPPDNSSWPLDRYVEPEKFDELKDFAIKEGFKSVASGPMVRSSYHAESSYGQLFK